MIISDISIAEKIANKFNVPGKLISCEGFGDGHINDTYLLKAENLSGEVIKYVLQSVNTNVFKNIYAIMENISLVTEHLKSKATKNDRVLNFLKAEDGNTYYVDDEGMFWRIYMFIDKSICLQMPETLEDFYECAVAFGNFQKNLADFPADSLNEIIPDFHNTPKRYEAFLEAVNADVKGRASSVKDEIDFFIKRKDFYSILFDEHKNGNLPLRVSHNDTKCNNALLDEKNRKALCVIDLDTVMPGFSVTDYGDAIRFGASTAGEDEKDLTKVNFDFEKFKIYTQGFLDGCGGLLTDNEIMLLPEGAKMMTVECGMRFLTDYLNGDTYFKTEREGQNLDRCRTQIKLVSDMESVWQEMKSLVGSFVEK